MRQLIDVEPQQSVIKGSKFISYASSVQFYDEAKEWISQLWGIHQKATHICSAFIFGAEQEFEYYDDNGEPALSAGKPILDVMKHHDITNTAIGVVRYFGGIKLGKGGLIRAYSSSAKSIVEQGNFLEILQVTKAQLELDYSTFPIFEYEISNMKDVYWTSEFTNEVKITLYGYDSELQFIVDKLSKRTKNEVQLIGAKKVIIEKTKNKIKEKK